MNAQQIQFAETIRAMKLALKRKPDDSDSDSSIHAPTNRGNKLKRRARHVRTGRLDTTGGQAYKRRVTHAGYHRATISTNPPLFDEDGDPYSPTASEAENGTPHAAAAPIRENPFGDIKLEELLRPLTSPAELHRHPGLSEAFTSKALTQMAAEAQEMVRREKATLWKAKRLLQRMRGDLDWAPCGRFEADTDEMLLFGDVAGAASQVPSVSLDAPDVEMEAVAEGGEVQEPVTNGRTARDGEDSDAMKGVEASDMVSAHGPDSAEEKDASARDSSPGQEEKPKTNNLTESYHANDRDSTAEQAQTEDATPSNPALAEIQRALDHDRAASEHASATSSKENHNPAGPSHTMTTRARARSPQPTNSPPSSPTPSDSTSIPAIHPWFLPAASAQPDKNLGLPATEAEETRKLLLLYVQKQENIVRGLSELYSGLARAERLRGEVWRACKAEGHMREDARGNRVTEMSDGEDWYDVEEWGWPEGTVLEKGKDEVEEGEEESRRGGRRRVGRRI